MESRDPLVTADMKIEIDVAEKACFFSDGYFITGEDTAYTTGKDTDNTAGVERDGSVPTPTSQTGARYQSRTWCPAELGTRKESGVNLEPDIKLASISVPSVYSDMDCDTKHDIKFESNSVPSVYCDMNYDTKHDIKLDSNSVSGVYSDANCDTKHDIKLQSNSVPSVYSNMDCDTKHDIKPESNSVSSVISDFRVSVELDGRTLSTVRNPLTSESRSAEESQMPFVCGLCAACFQLSSQLLQHMSTHTGQKPYTVITEQKTTTADSPRTHLSRGQQMVISALRKAETKANKPPSTSTGVPAFTAMSGEPSTRRRFPGGRGTSGTDIEDTGDPGGKDQPTPVQQLIREHDKITTQSTGTNTVYPDQSTKVADRLDSCPGTLSVVTTVNMIAQSTFSTASGIPFPALQNYKVAVEELDQEDALSTEYEDSNVSEYKPSDGDSDDSIDEDTSIQESSTHLELFVKRAVSRNGSIVLDKKQFCYFCGTPQLKHARHVTTQHTGAPFVARLLAKQNSDPNEYLKGLRRLKCLGNFVHNVKSMKEGRNDIVVVKRPTKERKISEYLPCIHCYGFYLIDELWKHTKNCDLKTFETDLNVHNCADDSKKLLTDSNIVRQSKFLLVSACLPDTVTDRFSVSSDTRSLISRMHDDELTGVVSKDCILLRFGETLLSKYGPTSKNDIGQGMRQLARLLVQVRENLKDSTLTFYDALCGKQFDACLEGTMSICGLNITKDGRREFAIPSLALRLGHLLRKLVATKQGYCLRNNDLDGLKQAETFGQLLQGEWTDKIATNAHNTLKRRRDQTIQVLSVTEDLRILRAYQMKEMKHTIEILQASPSYSTWRKLAQLTMTRMTIFNKRRGGEVSKLQLKTYQTRPDWKGNTNEEVLKSLEPLERKLLNRVDLVQIPGKKARKVPMLITMDVKQGIDVLNANRESVGIPSSNPFCFASRSSCGHLNNWQSLNLIAQEANLSHPEHVTSTKLRKYNATVSQLFDLNHGELEWLSNRMGHDLNIHKDFCRLHDSTIEIAKVSHLLMAIDTGNASKFIGKQLDEINLNDFQFEEQGHEDEDVPEEHFAVEADSEDMSMNTTQKSSSKRRKTSQQRKRVHHLSDSESEYDRAKPMKKSVKLGWSHTEIETLKTLFGHDLRKGLYPSGKQIQLAIKHHDCLRRRNTLTVRSKLQHLMSNNSI